MKTSFFILLCSLWSVMTYAAPSYLTEVRVTEIHDKTTVTFTLSTPVNPSVFSLFHPHRLVFDFNQTRLKTHLKTIKLKYSTLLAIREGYPDSSKLRIVLDLPDTVHYKMLAKTGKQVTVELTKNKAQKTQPSTILKAHPVRKKTPPDHLLTVVIDPGHGGKDPGAMGEHGTKEKDIVFAIANQLADLINQEPNMRAILTRTGDYYVTLQDRLRIARRVKADLFIAIHADSYFNTHASGASVYSLSEHGATSVAARWLAKKDNYSELDGVDFGELEDQSYLLRSVLIDLAQTATTKASLRWGTSLLNALDDVTALHYPRVEQAPFMVLKSPDIPSVLVETGFISNKKEEVRLRDRRHQQKIALALFNGIRIYQQHYSPRGTSS